MISQRNFFVSPSKRNVKITYLFLSFLRQNCDVVQNFSNHEFPERNVSRFISSSPQTRSRSRMLNSIVMAQSLGAKQKTLIRKTAFLSATAFSRFPCTEVYGGHLGRGIWQRLPLFPTSPATLCRHFITQRILSTRKTPLSLCRGEGSRIRIFFRQRYFEFAVHLKWRIQQSKGIQSRSRIATDGGCWLPPHYVPSPATFLICNG